MMLDAFHYKESMMHAIGERPYKIIFGHLREELKSFLDQESKPLGVMRIQNGQIMGKEVKDSLTQKNTEQGRTTKELCQHPTASITQGGECEVVHLLGLHDAMAAAPDP